MYASFTTKYIAKQNMASINRLLRDAYIAVTSTSTTNTSMTIQLAATAPKGISPVTPLMKHDQLNTLLAVCMVFFPFGYI